MSHYNIIIIIIIVYFDMYNCSTVPMKVKAGWYTYLQKFSTIIYTTLKQYLKKEKYIISQRIY